MLIDISSINKASIIIIIIITIIIIIVIIIIWSEAQSHLPKNIYNFTIRYINNSLPTRKSMARWGLPQSPDCSFSLNPESLLRVVAGCQQYLGSLSLETRLNA